MEKMYKDSDIEFDLEGATEFDYRRITDNFNDDFYENKDCLNIDKQDKNEDK